MASYTLRFGIFFKVILSFQLFVTDAKAADHACFNASTSRGHLYGQETFCSMIPISYSNATPFIISWNTSSNIGDPSKALVFIQDRSPQVQLLNIGHPPSSCVTTTSLNPKKLPSWTSSPDFQVLVRELGSHCFSKRFRERPGAGFYFDVLYKISPGNGSDLFRVKEVAYMLPSGDEYWIFQEERTVDNICTRCFGAGGFGQKGLLQASNLTCLLQQLNCNYMLD